MEIALANMQLLRTQLRRRGLVHAFRYHAFTLWLFTVNDLKTMVFPSTAFAFFSCSYMGVPTAQILSRLPSVLLWAWVNLLAFAVNNQRSSSAVTEDRLNKPWRPMPSKRISDTAARHLGMLAYLLAQIASLLAGGGLAQSVSIAVGGHVYNSMGGGSGGCLVRNVLNAGGFVSFASGALEVATSGVPKQSLRPMMGWLVVIALVVATTVHSQDMYDQEGDAEIGRRTVPLVIGDRYARWTILVAMAFWSVFCPFYWQSGMAGYILTGVLGMWAGWRTVFRTSVAEDRSTFRIYNVWLMSNYLLPLVA